MDNELVSVIIPVYNVQEYLDKCISSVINQTYKNIEIIIIDDGSTDNSLSICKKYSAADKRIKLISKKNSGISATRNLGLKETNGEYIFWVDSDDYVADYAIEELYRNIKKYNCDMSICEFVQGSEKDYSFDKKNSEPLIFDNVTGLNMIYKNHHFSFVMAASWAKLIKKSLYDGLIYPEGKIFEDIYMSHHLINRCKKIVYLDETMYYYFKWPESILGKKFGIEKFDYLGAFEERIQMFGDLKYFDLKAKATIQYLHALIWEYSRAKDILHNKTLVRFIIHKYRKYYYLGAFNSEAIQETKLFMFLFYISPFLTDLNGKILAKLKRGRNE